MTVSVGLYMFVAQKQLHSLKYNLTTSLPSL